MLVVFGGLPGTGKTTIARMVAARCVGTYIRIDAIEQAIRSVDVLCGDMGPVGYIVAYAVAANNLDLGRIVVADSVNPLPITREALRSVATKAKTKLIEVETVCTDKAEHRRRVETRAVDIPGLVPPTWTEVEGREYAAWTDPHIIVDTAHLSAADAAALVCRKIEAASVEDHCGS